MRLVSAFPVHTLLESIFEMMVSIAGTLDTTVGKFHNNSQFIGFSLWLGNDMLHFKSSAIDNVVTISVLDDSLIEVLNLYRVTGILGASRMIHVGGKPKNLSLACRAVASTSLPRYDAMGKETRRGGKCFFGGDIISPLIALCCCFFLHDFRALKRNFLPPMADRNKYIAYIAYYPMHNAQL